MDAEDERELLKKIRALEEGQAELKRQVSKLQRRRRGSSSHHHPAAEQSSSASPSPSTSRSRRTRMSARHHMMAMQSLGQAAHVLDLHGKVLCWNRNAERLYHYTSAEAVGQDITRLIIHPDDIPALNTIVGNIFTAGKCWRGKFPVKKSGERFFVVADATPLYDDDDETTAAWWASSASRMTQEHWTKSLGLRRRLDTIITQRIDSFGFWCSLLHTESSLKSLEVSH